MVQKKKEEKSVKMLKRLDGWVGGWMKVQLLVLVLEFLYRDTFPSL